MHKFLQDESGATSIEYAMIASLIAVAIITALYALHTSMIDLYTLLGTAIGGSLA